MTGVKLYINKCITQYSLLDLLLLINNFKSTLTPSLIFFRGVGGTVKSLYSVVKLNLFPGLGRGHFILLYC